MEKILELLSENLQFLMVKFSIYLNRRVFVMTNMEVHIEAKYTNYRFLVTITEKLICDPTLTLSKLQVSSYNGVQKDTFCLHISPQKCCGSHLKHLKHFYE